MSGNTERTQRLKAAAEQIVFCSLLALFAFLPFLNGTVPAGEDTAFYFNRIEAISLSFRSHVIPAVYRNQNYGYGYGTPLFLPDLFLYIPAFFRLHMSLLSAYRLSVYLIFFAQAVSMYSVMKKMTGKDRTALYLSTMLFVCCTYCWASLINNGTLSESISAVFVPQVIYGLYNLFRFGKWHRLAVSLSGMILSDPPLGLVMFLIFICMCIRHHKDPDRRRDILTGAGLAGIAAVGISAGYILTLGEQILAGDYYIDSLFRSSASLMKYTEWFGLFDLIPSGYEHFLHSVGFGLLFLPLLCLKTHGKNAGFAREIMLIGYILLLGSFKLFPWIILPPAGILRYSQRLFHIASGCLAFSAGYGFSHVAFRRKDRDYIRRSLAGLCLMSSVLMVSVQFNIIGAVSRYNDINQAGSAMTSARYNANELGRGLFLPKGSYIYSSDNRIARHASEVLDCKEDTESYSCPFDGSGSYVFPVTWYKGWKLTVLNDGAEIYTAETAADAASGLVSFELPESLPKGSILELTYRRTAVQRTGTVISLASLITFAVFAVMNRIQD